VTRRIRERKVGEDPSAPPLALFVATSFLLLISFIYAAKIYDLSLSRGTLLTENTSLKSAPDDAASEITQFPAGIELVLKEKRGDWLQVQHPGSFTGWVKADTILITSLTSPKQSH
jgi:hypothetical protein